MRLRWGLVVVALVAAGCGSEDSERAPTTSTPASTAAAPSSTAPSTTIPLVSVEPGEDPPPDTGPGTSIPIDRPPPTTEQPAIAATTLAPGDSPTVEVVGRGVPQWFSTDGSTVLVVVADPARPSPWCGGVTRPRLSRLPLDGSPSTVGILGTNADVLGALARPGEGQASLLPDCEGALTALVTGREAPNGLLADMATTPLSRPVSFVGSFTTSSDGSSFVVSTTGTGTREPTVVAIDARNGAVTDLFPGQFLRITGLADGSYIGLTWDQEIRRLDPSGSLVDTVPGNAYAVSPERDRVAVITGDELRVGDIDGASAVSVELPGASSDTLGVWRLAFLADGVALSRLSSIDQPVWLATDAGALVRLLEPDEWGELVVSADGTTLATNRPLADPDDLFAEETVIVTR